MNRNYSFQLLRWEVISALVITLLVATFSLVIYPYGKSLIRSALLIYNQKKFSEQAYTIETEIRLLKSQTASLDSLISKVNAMDSIPEATMVAALYQLADSVKLTTSKIETSPSLESEKYFETPVIIRGQGDYVSIGRFIEGVENQPVPSRIRQITLKNKANGEGELYLDFVGMMEK